MAHLPVNHPARPYYRVLAAAIGLYILGFGVVGFVETSGLEFFDRGEHWVLGLRTNPAFSVLNIVVGLVLLGGTVYGRNVDHIINMFGSIVFLVAGIVMMTLLRTEANLLNFAIENCVVSFLFGLALLVSGLYGKTGSQEFAEAEEKHRHGTPPDADLPAEDPAQSAAVDQSASGGDASPASASPRDETARSTPG